MPVAPPPTALLHACRVLRQPGSVRAVADFYYLHGAIDLADFILRCCDCPPYDADDILQSGFLHWWPSLAAPGMRRRTMQQAIPHRQNVLLYEAERSLLPYRVVYYFDHGMIWEVAGEVACLLRFGGALARYHPVLRFRVTDCPEFSQPGGWQFVADGEVFDPAAWSLPECLAPALRLGCSVSEAVGRLFLHEEY